MKRLLFLGVSAMAALASAPAVLAFCGFYVAKADTKLFNQASQVVLVRNDDKTVLTMASDFKGDPKEFAVVVPVPTLLEKGQIHVGERATIEHLDAYTAPRLVEYFDENPCQPRMLIREQAQSPAAAGSFARDADVRAKSRGVTIEARYTVGEYDILILSARESSGLETWLRENGYRIPSGASAILGSYIKQNMNLPPSTPGRVRLAQVHAADPAGHRERGRAAGALRLRADAPRPRGDHELSDSAAAQRRRASPVRA